MQTERVAAWRELARRLAHELKNPLFPSANHGREYAARARAATRSSSTKCFAKAAATLLAELANLKQIVARFSDFAKMPAPEMQPVDFNALVADTMKLFEAQFAQARVAARPELDAGPAPRYPPIRNR